MATFLLEISNQTMDINIHYDKKNSLSLLSMKNDLTTYNSKILLIFYNICSCVFLQIKSRTIAFCVYMKYIFQKYFPAYQTVQTTVLRFIILFTCVPRDPSGFQYMYYEFLSQFRQSVEEAKSEIRNNSAFCAALNYNRKVWRERERSIFVLNRINLSRGRRAKLILKIARY